MAKITVQNTDISVVKYNEEDYISLTDMARSQLQDEHGNIFAKMNTSAFIVEDKIHAIYENGKLYFQSYTIANQIFSLIDFVTEATNTEIESFGEIKGIDVKKYGINAQINGNNELVLPTNNVVELNRTLEFLNEDIFRGIITDSLYRSNSKKKDNR